MQPADPAGPDLVGADPLPFFEDLDPGDLAGASTREVEALTGPHRSGEHPDVGRLLAGPAPLDLEHPARRLARRGRHGAGQERRDPGHQVGNAGTGGRRSGEHRVQHRVARLGCGFGEELARRTVAPFDVRREQGVVVLGQDNGLTLAEGVVLGSVRREGRGPRPEPRGGAHRQDVRGQPAADRLQDTLDVGARAVDLVDEQQGRHPEPLQRPHQDPGLGLDPLDRGQQEHGPVEHAEDALDLGDEVGVARGVDDVDRRVVERERHHGGLDRDAAPALQREAVGPGGAGVDRSRLVDDPREVQEALGEGGLTGVDVGEDAQVE